jgi:hypothetical protein
MYATFVAPVQQYSTETEPSRQPSFNYSSRQPSFKQNSSENENPGSRGGGGGSADRDLFFPGGLPPPSCGGDHEHQEEEVQDIYEKVPIVGEWPLPPIPRHQDDDDNDGYVEISQAELENQVAQERNSFISGSSNNEDDEEEEEDEEECSMLHIMPRAPPSLLSDSPLPPSPYLPTLAQEASMGQWGSGEESGEPTNTAGTFADSILSS